MADPYYTVVLSGPRQAQRALEVALAGEGVADTPLGTTWHMMPPTLPCPTCWRERDPECGECGGDGFVPDPTVTDVEQFAWVRAIHADIDRVVELGARFGYRLRRHHPTGAFDACGGDGSACLHCKGLGVSNTPVKRKTLAEMVEELQGKVAALEGRA